MRMASAMQAEPLSEATWVADEARLAVLHGSGLLERPPEAEFDRWTAALQQETRAAVAAFLLVDRDRVVLKSFVSRQGAAPETAEVALSEPLAEYLIGRAGGLPRGLKAIATSGPSGGFLPRKVPVSKLKEGFRAELSKKKRALAGKVPEDAPELDVLDLEPPSAQRIVADTVARFGRVDILVNCAGIGPYRPLGAMDAALADRNREYEP